MELARGGTAKWERTRSAHCGGARTTWLSWIEAKSPWFGVSIVKGGGMIVAAPGPSAGNGRR